MQLNDSDKLKRMMERFDQITEANKLKDRALKAGYWCAMSLYGIVRHSTTQHAEYRRIEILSNDEWTSETVELIYRFFSTVKPNRIYTIWLHDAKRNAIVLIGEFD